MFSGIIEEIGTIKRIVKVQSLARLEIVSDKIYKQSLPSDSVSINGVCLTVSAKEKNIISFDVVKPTLERTTLGQLKKGNKVNCETALKVGDKLGGHFVLGHVDAKLRLQRIVKKGSYHQLEIVLLPNYRRYIIENGSIAIDGVSLTIKKIYSKFFTVDVIPFTFSHTILQYKKAGDCLNVEFDYLLKARVAFSE